MTHTVTMYIAAPGTPTANGGASLPGHMFYVLNDGHSMPLSFGFAPDKAHHGRPFAPGLRYDDDNKRYLNPLYSRTLEISEQQYEAMKTFGEKQEQFGFSTYYNALTNSCVDFAWAGLAQAGLHKSVDSGGLVQDEKGFEGYIRPARNVEAIQSIQAPYPLSPLNTEHTNPMPKRSVIQHLLTENDRPLEQSTSSPINPQPAKTSDQASLPPIDIDHSQNPLFSQSQAAATGLYTSKNLDYDKQGGNQVAWGVYAVAVENDFKQVSGMYEDKGVFHIVDNSNKMIPSRVSVETSAVFELTADQSRQKVEQIMVASLTPSGNGAVQGEKNSSPTQNPDIDPNAKGGRLLG